MKCSNCKEEIKPEKKDRFFRCPNCNAELETKSAFLKTEKPHKDWYNVPGKIGKQRKKPKYDTDA